MSNDGGLAERDSGGTEDDTGGGGAVAGRESAEGFRAEGVQAGGVLGGAADALRYGAVTRCGDRDSPARGEPGRGACDGGWRGVERLEEWMGGSGRPPQRAKSARRRPRSRLRAMHPSHNRELGHLGYRMP